MICSTNLCNVAVKVERARARAQLYSESCLFSLLCFAAARCAYAMEKVERPARDSLVKIKNKKQHARRFLHHVLLSALSARTFSLSRNAPYIFADKISSRHFLQDDWRERKKRKERKETTFLSAAICHSFKK